MKAKSLINQQHLTVMVRNLSLALMALLAIYTLFVVFVLRDFNTSILILLATHGLLFTCTFALCFQQSLQAIEQARYILVCSCMTLLTTLSLMWQHETGLQHFLLVGMVTTGFIFLPRERKQRRIVEYGYASLFLMVEFLTVIKDANGWDALRLANSTILVVGGLILLRVLRGKIEKQAEALTMSERKNRELLRSMLPNDPNNPHSHWQPGQTQKLDNVCVLFADLQGYTALSERYEDAHIVTILDSLYQVFDQHALRMGIEKIKTNGDEYMAAIGIPLTFKHHDEQPLKPAETMCQFAIAVLSSFKQLSQTLEMGCNIRIGIATGSVTGGIIGAHKPHFDIWGKTVNRAARLEQASSPGKITVCARTRGQVFDSTNPLFAFSSSFVIDENLVAHELLPNSI